jgi:threonine synthase
VAEAETLAEGIRISFPLRGDVLLQTLNQHKGTILAVDEDAILPGRKALAGMGFYVEPTSAVVWNAMEQVSDQIPEPIVLVLTGSGLKWVGP